MPCANQCGFDVVLAGVMLAGLQSVCVHAGSCQRHTWLHCHPQVTFQAVGVAATRRVSLVCAQHQAVAHCGLPGVKSRASVSTWLLILPLETAIVTAAGGSGGVSLLGCDVAALFFCL